MKLQTSDRIYVAGHRGLVGSSIVRRLESEGHGENVIKAHRHDVDLRFQADAQGFFFKARPKYVFAAAAVVGGIGENSKHPGKFIGENLAIQTNLIYGAMAHGVDKFLFLGSSCIYPKFAPQPIPESALLTGPLEPTNEAYAVAKIAGITMCQAYAKEYGFNAISLMPTNLYGPGDNFDLESSHVVPALIRKFHEAKENGDRVVTAWGTGTPLREFLYVDDLADACVFLMENYDSPEIINVGTGEDVSIEELMSLIAIVVGYRGVVEFDTAKPDGAPRKLLDVGKINKLGWKAQTGLEEGLERTYAWYRERTLPIKHPPC